MWTSTLDLTSGRILLTRLLGRVWPGAYFSSFAPLRVENLPRQPLPAPDWVRVRNRLAGIGGNDLHRIYADSDLRVATAALPNTRIMYPGHEVVGEVIEIGANVQHLHVGDRVVLQHDPNCISANVHPRCRSCASGNYSLCEYGALPGPYPFGGGWSEEMLLHEQQLFPVPAALSDEQAVMLEPTSVAVHAVLRRLPQPGEHILIIGAGTIGLLTLAVIRALVPEAEVSVLARHPFQIEQATRLGAARIIYPQDNYNGIQRATQAQLYHGSFGNKMLLGGFDGIYDTIGSSKTVHSALRWARANSTVTIVGLSLRMMRLDLTPVWHQEVNLLGSMSHGTEHWPLGSQERRSSFDLAAELIEHRQVYSENLITHRFALTNYQNAFLTAVGKTQSRSIKVVFDYSLLPTTVVPNVRTSSRLRRPSVGTSPLPSSPPSPPQEAVSLTSNTTNIPITPLPSTPLTPPIDGTKAVPRQNMMEDTDKSPSLKKPARVTPRLPLSQEQAPIQMEQAISPASEIPILIPTDSMIPTEPTVPVMAPPDLTPATNAVATSTPADIAALSTDKIIGNEALREPEEANTQLIASPTEEALESAESTEPPSNPIDADKEPATSQEIDEKLPSMSLPEFPAEEAAISQEIDDKSPSMLFPELPKEEAPATAEITTLPETAMATTIFSPTGQSPDASASEETGLALSETTEETGQPDAATPDLSLYSAAITEQENGEDAATKDESDSLPIREGVSTARKTVRPRRRKKNPLSK